ncbi:MAG: DUF3800 domain-containing protein [Actinomycetota bacterium]|nr:DUF3800 domain-containing protein [Actinomycetota bacterium]
MNVFIDESGGFTKTRSQPHYVCCVAALVVPESCLSQLLADFTTLEAAWTDINGEVKGSKLGERRISRVIRLISNYNALLQVVAIDLGMHDNTSIERHKHLQAQAMTHTLTSAHQETLREEIRELANSTAGLANQLYVEAMLMAWLVANVLQTATFYYSQTDPPTLGAFRWRIDAKDRSLTGYESLWSSVVSPILQSISLRNPMIFLKGGDYSAFAPFENPELQRPPEHLRSAVRHAKRPFSSFSNNAVMADLHFQNSCSSPGIRLADILANTFQRACNGRLAARGWKDLGLLLVAHPATQKAVSFVALSQAAGWAPITAMPYGTLVASLEAQARGSLVDGTAYR